MRVGWDDLLTALPAHQRASARTALARLEERGQAAQVVAEWHAGAELRRRGELSRFSPAGAFFFLFGRATRGEFFPIWGPSLATVRQAEADEAAASEAELLEEGERMMLAAELRSWLGDEALLRAHRAHWPSTPGSTAPDVAAQQIAAAILAGEFHIEDSVLELATKLTDVVVWHTKTTAAPASEERQNG